jgi:hypothetical protein
LAAFDKRVIVSGLLRRNGRGQPVRLDVDQLELAPKSESISASELVGAAMDLGGELSATEFVARQRGRR